MAMGGLLGLAIKHATDAITVSEFLTPGHTTVGSGKAAVTPLIMAVLMLKLSGSACLSESMMFTEYPILSLYSADVTLKVSYGSASPGRQVLRVHQ